MSTLYIVATPIGNLDDFSARAIDTLKQVSYIACEDTRTSGKLLSHYGIETQTFSFHQHNEHQKVDYLVDLLEGGHSVAVISDAGMPGISDPGFLATRAAHQKGLPVCVIPGPDAATTGLVASGLPCDRYVYEGFLPAKKGRQKQLKSLVDEERTIVFFESPYRVLKLLEELQEYFGANRLVAVTRELTKKFEEIVRGPVSQVRTNFEQRDSLKGEFVIVVAGCNYTE